MRNVQGKGIDRKASNAYKNNTDKGNESNYILYIIVLVHYPYHQQYYNKNKNNNNVSNKEELSQLQ